MNHNCWVRMHLEEVYGRLASTPIDPDATISSPSFSIVVHLFKGNTLCKIAHTKEGICK